MPIFGTGPKRTDGKTNFQINATPTYLTPTQVPNLAVWFDAADTSTLTTNISSLNIWYSKTNISSVMSNAFGLPGPIWRSTTQNGLPVVRFDGTNNSFMSSISMAYNATTFVTNNETTMLLAYNPTNTGCPFGVTNTSYGGDGIRLHPQGCNWFFGNIFPSPNNARLEYVQPAGGFKVESYYGRQGTLGFRNNGSLYATSTIVGGLSFPAGTNYHVQMGGLSYGSRQFTQDIGEALIYNRGLSDFELRGIEAYLARKWGTQSALPYQHPGRPTGAPLMGYKLITYPRLVSNYGLWYDAMDTSTIKDVGGNFPPLLPPNALGVGQWNDKSGNNKHLSNQATNPSQFNLMSPGTFYPAVFSPGYSNGAYYNLRVPNNNPISYTGSSISAFYVLSVTPNANNNTFFSLSSTFTGTMPIPINPIGANVSTFDFSLNYISNTIGFSRFGGGGPQFGVDPRSSNNIITAPFTTNTTTLVSMFINGDSTTLGNVLPSTNLISINGAFVSSSTRYVGNPFNLQYISMFGNYNYPANSVSYFNEVAIFYRTLTTPERLLIENQLIRKWGLPSNAPISYINAGPNISTPYLWVDAYNPSYISTTVTSDGLTRVDTAFDRSGNGRNFKIDTTYSNVFYNRASTMNSMNSLYFSTGTYNGLLVNSNPLYTFSTNSFSWFMVYNQISTPMASSRLFYANRGLANNENDTFSYQLVNIPGIPTQARPWYVRGTYQTAGDDINRGSNYLTSIVVNNGPTIDTLLPSTYNVYQNFGSGPVLTSNIEFAAPSTVNINYFGIGSASNSFLTTGFNGLISEVILYNRALSNAERQSIETYLLNKWNISTLVSNVPVTRGLNLWLDAYDPASVITDTNCNVLLWRDKSLCNFNFSNANAGTATQPLTPLYATNLKNNLPGLLFSSDYITSRTCIYNCNFRYPNPNEGTCFSVFQIRNPPTNEGHIFVLLSNNENSYTTGNGFYMTANTARVTVNRSSFANTIFTTTTVPTLLTGVFNSSFSTSLILDIPQNHMAAGRNGMIGATNISSGISTLGNAAFSSIKFNVGQAMMGARTTTGGDVTTQFDGYIHETLLYNRTLSYNERQQVESYLMSKWGI